MKGWIGLLILIPGKKEENLEMGGKFQMGAKIFDA